MNRKEITFLCLIFLFLLFPCMPAAADWCFAVLGDSRDDYRYNQVFPEMIREIGQTAYRVRDQELKAEFLLHLGDFELSRGSQNSLERFRDRLKGLKIKYYVAKGSHELVERKRSAFTLPSIHEVLKNNQDFIREYKSFFNLKETYYSFDHRDLHVIVLDNSFGTFQVKPDEEIHSEQLLWLEKDLEETAGKVQGGQIRHTIICTHMPLPSPSPSITTHDMLEVVTRQYAEGRVLAEESARIFWQILEQYREKSRLSHLYFGHDHRYVSYRQNGFPVTITGGAGAPPVEEERGGFYHYLIIQVTGRELKERIIRVYPAKKTP